MATTTPPISLHEEVETDNGQPAIAGSPSPTSVPSPTSPIKDVDHHQQFSNSNSPYSPPQISLTQLPENLVDRQPQPPPPPEEIEELQEPPVPPSPPPEEKILDGQAGQHYIPPPTSPSPSVLPPSSSPTGVNHPPENVNPNQESSISKQPTPPSPLTPPSAAEDPVESPNYRQNPNSYHESPLSKQPPSPSPSTPPSGPEDPVESHNYRKNPNSDHESPLSKEPPSPSLSTPPGPKDHVESPNYRKNPNSDHESPLSKQPPSPSPSGPEDPVKSPNYHKNLNPNPDHESPSPSSPAKFQGSPSPSPKSHQSPKDPSQSPPLTAGSPSSPQETLDSNTDLTTPPPLGVLPLGVPLLLHTVATSSPIKSQPSPWTHQETANLIQAYQEKWYSLKKGPLKAGQWEEVAITVAARCGYDEPTKTAKQCRHKIEKLRKRYRAERGKPRSKATVWNFFKLMDNLEKGPLPISSKQPMELVEYQKPSNSNGKKRKIDENDGEFLDNKRSRSKISNNHIANGGLTRNLRFSDGGNERVVRGLRTPVIRKHKGFYQEDNGDEETEEEEEEEEEGDDDGDNGGEDKGVAAQLAAEIKGFAEKFVKMENKKIEMMRDVEKYRSEMENKRMEMILESQQMLVEAVNKAFNKTHKFSAN